MIFVNITVLHSGNESRPDSGMTQCHKRMATPVPTIEIPDNRNILGRWSPNGKPGAGHARQMARMRAQVAVQAELAPFIKKVHILLTQTTRTCGRKKITVF
jgi:hypothetical protein